MKKFFNHLYVKLIQHKNLITIWVKIVTILLAIIFFYAGVYRPALVVMFFFLKKEVESVPGFLEFQENRKKSHEMVEGHWSKDQDLIWIRRFIRLIYVLALLFFIKFFYCLPINLLEWVDGDVILIDQKGFWFVFVLGGLGLAITFIMDIHILFFRNFPGKPKE